MGLFLLHHRGRGASDEFLVSQLFLLGGNEACGFLVLFLEPGDLGVHVDQAGEIDEHVTAQRARGGRGGGTDGIGPHRRQVSNRH